MPHIVHAPIYNLPCTGDTSNSFSLSESSASLLILSTSSPHVGMSWMRPMTWPAVHTC